MNLRSYAVPVATFALALALSLAIAPVPRLSARVAQSMTGSPGCDTFMEIPERDTWLPRGNEGGEETEKGNSILVRLKWEPTGGHADGTTRRFTFRFEGPPALKGICNNKGKESYPDFTVEQSDNPEWKIDDGIPQYPGAQNVAAVTRNAYPPGVWVDIIVRSYDFGAWTKVVGAAEGCPEKKERIPKDTEEDTLPDVWELGKRFFDDHGHAIPYDITSPSTYLEELDGASDRDGGFVVDPRRPDRPLPGIKKLHDELGDGYSAFEEYRGVFVQGAFFRMEELENDGGPDLFGGSKGTLLKDVFVYDPDDLVSDGSAVLKGHGVAFHRIRQAEMSTEMKGNGSPLAGYVDFNSADKSQHAVWVRDQPTQGLGFSPGFSVNGEPEPIEVDVAEITLESNEVVMVETGRFVDFGELRDFTVAHEIGHLFSLKHPEGELHKGPPSPDRFRDSRYWIPGQDQTVLQTWTLVEKFRRNGGAIELRVLSKIPPLNRGDAVTRIASDVELGDEDHGFVHLAKVREYDYPGAAPLLRIVPFLEHTGSLMDWNAEFLRLDPPVYPYEARQIKIVGP